jgi:hypothetical protein
MIPKSANAKPLQPGDVRITKSARIVILPDNTQQTSPLLDIPILFHVDTADLRDDRLGFRPALVPSR